MAALDFPTSPTLNQIYTANDKSWIWDGTAWNPYGGDIVAVFDSLAPTTNKGDLIVHDGTDNVRLAVGATNGHVLTVDSAEATGVKWAAASGGKLAQVVYTEDATLVTTTAFFPQDNTTPQDNEGAAYTQLDTTITPTNSSSKLLIEAVVNFNANNVNTPNFGIFGPFSTNAIQFYSFTVAGNGFASVAILRVRVDAVNTNAQTYKVRFGSQNASYTTRINPSSGTTFNNSLKSTLTITEILP